MKNRGIFCECRREEGKMQSRYISSSHLTYIATYLPQKTLFPITVKHTTLDPFGGKAPSNCFLVPSC